MCPVAWGRWCFVLRTGDVGRALRECWGGCISSKLLLRRFVEGSESPPRAINWAVHWDYRRFFEKLEGPFTPMVLFCLSLHTIRPAGRFWQGSKRRLSLSYAAPSGFPGDRRI